MGHIKEEGKMKEKIRDKNKLQGIGGWLAILTAVLILQGLVHLFMAFYLISNFFVLDLSINVSIIYLVMTFLFIKTLFLEFKHKKQFVKWAVWTLWLQLPVRWLLALAFETISLIAELLVIIIVVILTIYLKRSKRIKNTFVN